MFVPYCFTLVNDWRRLRVTTKEKERCCISQVLRFWAWRSKTLANQ